MTAPSDAFVACAPGLELLAATELGALGVAIAGTEPGGVTFAADYAQLAAANLHLRTATRVTVRLGTFHASAFHELERHANKLPWDRYVAPGAAVAFRVTSKKSKLYHQRAIAERLTEAVAGRVGGAHALAAVAAEDDDDEAIPAAQEFVVRLFHDQCTVSADCSGALLHRRGYRLATAKAPLRETLAASLLLGAGWTGQAPLIDPFCGSGTIVIEAALLARGIAPGIARAFAMEVWPSADEAAWRAARATARERERPHATVPLIGSDRDAGAIEAAEANAERAGVAADVAFRRHAVSHLQPPETPGWMISNPPYGARVGELAKLRDLYAQIGNVARRRLGGWQLALLTANRRLEGYIGLPFEEQFRTTNGGIPVRLSRATVKRFVAETPGPGNP